MELASYVTQNNEGEITGAILGEYGSWDTPEDLITSTEEKIRGSYSPEESNSRRHLLTESYIPSCHV